MSTAGRVTKLQRSFAYRVSKWFPSEFLRWIDVVSELVDNFTTGTVIELNTTLGASDSLRSTIPTTVNLAAVVDGCNIRGDGGWGVWFWNATSILADNIGTVVKPTAHVGPGRWIRIFSGEINVRWFGATGDGVTDDLIPINLALAFVASISGVGIAGAVAYFPEGSYLISAGLAPLTRGIGMVGDGRNRSLIRCTAAVAADFLTFTGASAPHISNLGLKSTVDNLAHRAIVLSDCDEILVEDVSCSWVCTGAGRHKATGIALLATGPHVPPVGNGSVLRNIVNTVDDSHGIPAAVGSRAILLQGVPTQSVQDVSIEGSSNLENAEYGLRLEYCSNIKLSGATFFQGNGRTAPSGASVSLANSQECEIQGVHSSSPHSGVHIEEESTSLHNSYVVPSIFNPTFSGINLNPDGDSILILSSGVTNSVLGTTEFRQRDVRNSKTTRGAWVNNPTAATAIVQQQSSPDLSTAGNAWDTGAAASKPFEFSVQTRALAGNPADASWTMALSTDGGASFTDIYTITSGGRVIADKLTLSFAAPDVFLSRGAAHTLKVDDGAGGANGVVWATSGIYANTAGNPGWVLGNGTSTLDSSNVIFNNTAGTVTSATLDTTGILMNGGLKLTTAGQIVMPEIAAPGIPAAGTDFLYFDQADGKLKFRDSGGTVHVVTTVP